MTIAVDLGRKATKQTIILMGKRELVGLLSLSSWCLLIVVRFFLAVSWVCLQFVIVVFPDHTHLLFWERNVLLPYRAAWIIIQRILSKGKNGINSTLA